MMLIVLSEIQDGKVYHPWVGYGQTKSANMLFAISLAEKLGRKGLVAVSVHPGGIKTNLATNSGSNFDSLSKYFAFNKRTSTSYGLT